MALLAGLMLIGAGAVRAQAQEPAPAEPNDVRVDRFRQQLEADRERLKIPGLSAVILEDGEVLWTQGFGYADVERRVPATPDTLYHIASVTKTFTAILVLQLVEQGKLDLDAPVSRYVPEIKDDRVRIKHLLSHTSEGTPGEKFSYNPERFEHLKAILEQATGKPLREQFVETFLEPLAMRDSVPGPDVVDDAQTWAVLGEANLERYRQALARVAQPYTYYGDGEVVRTSYPPADFWASAGLRVHRARPGEVRRRRRSPRAPRRGDAGPRVDAVPVERRPAARAGPRLVRHRLPRHAPGLALRPLGHRLFRDVPEDTGAAAHARHARQQRSPRRPPLPGRRGHHPQCLRLQLHPCVRAGGGEQDAVCPIHRRTRRRASPTAPSTDCERTSRIALEKWIADRRAKARRIVPLEPTLAAAYAGRYQFPGRIATITREGSRLFIDFPQGARAELFAESPTQLFLKIRPWTMTFVREGERVVRIDILDTGEIVPAPRVE